MNPFNLPALSFSSSIYASLSPSLWQWAPGVACASLLDRPPPCPPGPYRITFLRGGKRNS